jgi:hypothetical protein
MAATLPRSRAGALTARELACESDDMIRTLTFALLLISVGCGGKDKAAPGTTPAAHEHEGHEGHEGDEHAGMSAEMTRFHDLLRPLWHAEQGPARMTNTCGALAQLHTESDAIATATPPEPANADTWTAGTRALVAAVNDLDAACKGSDSAAFETAFGKVHDAFHALMEAGQTHGKGGGGTDGGGKDGSAEHGGH